MDQSNRGFAIVVIGASTGGIDSLGELFSELPVVTPAAFIVVLHVGNHPSVFPKILAARTALPTRHAKNGDVLRKGHVYVAPPDHHTIVRDSGLVLVRGPRVNWARPAIDPLFLTAAREYGPRVIGVVLSGELNDGTAGLYEIKHRGGITIVQDPSEAQASSMPESALKFVAVDHCVPIAKMSDIIQRAAKRVAATPSHLDRDNWRMSDV
jgi:two-component system, chemotaxis family, protein-glutamate methylesterase/glutaminase